MSRPLIFLLAAMAAGGAFGQQNEPADSLVHELNEIVVTAEQQVTRLVGTLLVSTIAGSPLADLGSALDVLGQLPMLKTDGDGVTVIGRGAPEIYVDGRPISDLSDLRILTSRNLRNVELIMAPGAEYDAATGAVLKITTRRNFIRGLSADNETEVKRGRRWSANDYLNLRYFMPGGWEVFGQGIYTHYATAMHGRTVNSLIYDGRPAEVGATQNTAMTANNYGFKGGFNRQAGEGGFGAYYRMLHEHGNFGNTGTEWLDAEAAVGRVITRGISALNHYAQAYYDNTFGGKYHLHFDGTAIVKNSDSDNMTSYPGGAHGDVPSRQKRHSGLYGGKLTLDFPLGPGRLVAGTEDSYTATRLDYRMLSQSVGQYIPSSLSQTAQTTLGAFGSYSARFGHWNVTAGLRYEYKDFAYTLDGVRDSALSRRDNFLTPDISFGYEWDNGASVSVSYRSITEQPSYSQLTDGLSYTGMHEIEGGNPALRDGRSHRVQLFGMWRDFLFQATFMRSDDTYGFVKRVYPADDLQLIFQPVNLDVSAAWFYLVWERPVGRWTPSITLSSNPQWLTLDGQKYDRPIWGYYFDNTFSLPHGWLATVNVYGRSAGNIHTQLFERQWFVMDMSVKKMFLDKTLSVKLSANNIFNTTSNGWRLQTYDVDMRKEQSYDDRSVALTVSYSFQPRKSGYRGQGAAESEADRL